MRSVFAVFVAYAVVIAAGIVLYTLVGAFHG